MTKNSSGWKACDGKEEWTVEVGGALLVSLAEKPAGSYHVPADREAPTSRKDVCMYICKGLMCMYEAAIMYRDAGNARQPEGGSARATKTVYIYIACCAIHSST